MIARPLVRSLVKPIVRGSVLTSGSILPSLDLAFALDKTLTARRGPNPVLTRVQATSTGSTYIGADKLIKYAAQNEPRFDHDPLTGVCKGLLIEEPRTNLALQSENHSSESWSKTGVTVASATNTAPNGSTTSNLVSEDSSTGLHRVFQSTAYVSGTSYAISVFLKYAGRQFVAITHPAVASNNLAIFDIQNGSVTLQQSGITASMVQCLNGWWRCIVNGVSSMTSSQSHIIQGSTTGGSLTGSYLGLNGPAFYIYGSQVEAGGFATSYIPTTTGTAVRSADVCSIYDAAFAGLWNNSEGSLFASGDIRAGGTAPVTYVMANSGANANQIAIFRNTGSISYGVANSGSYTANITTPSVNGSFNKIAGSYFTNDARAAFNSVLGNPDDSVVVPTNLTRLNIGSSGAASSEFANGCIASLQYYRKRLPNAKLQTLTTL